MYHVLRKEALMYSCDESLKASHHKILDPSIFSPLTRRKLKDGEKVQPISDCAG